MKKDDQTGLMLDTDYLLKLVYNGVLTNDFLMKIKEYLIKKNQETQEILNFLAIQQKNAYESVKQIITTTKIQVEDGDLHVLSKVKAGEYIKEYKMLFEIKVSSNKDTNNIEIEFPQPLPETNQVKSFLMKLQIQLNKL